LKHSGTNPFPSEMKKGENTMKTAAEKAFEALATEAIDLDVLERDEVTALVLEGGTWEEQYNRLRNAIQTRLDALAGAIAEMRLYFDDLEAKL
jgi:hypothetical protein